jgi:hypothetical protein
MKELRIYVQKIMVALEVPEAVPAEDLALEVAELLTDTLGAAIISMRVASTHSTLAL